MNGDTTYSRVHSLTTASENLNGIMHISRATSFQGPSLTAIIALRTLTSCYDGEHASSTQSSRYSGPSYYIASRS